MRQREAKIGCVIPVVLAVFLAAAILKVSDVMKNEETKLLTQASGLIELTDSAALSSYANTPVTFPTETFESELYRIGVYPELNDLFPKGTVALVYVKDGWRFVEIDEKPNLKMEEQLALYKGREQETVFLDETHSATLVRLPSNIQCLKPSPEVIGICPISKVLVFEITNLVVLIAADGSHATDGEIVQIARSMIDQEKSE